MALIDDLIGMFAVEIKAAFLEAMQDIVDSATIKNMIDAIKVGDLEAAFRALGYSRAMLRPLTASIERAYERGGVFTGTTFPKFINTPSGRVVFRFDARNSRAEAYLRDKSSTLVVGIEQSIRTTVQTTLTAGMQAGRNPRNTALDIVGRIDPATGKRTGGVVGLTPQQELWSRSARAKLETLDNGYFGMQLRDKRFDRTVAKAIEAGKPIPPEIVDKLVMRYRSNALRHRGENIARTESIQSLNAADHEATRQAVELGAMQSNAVKREWDNAGDGRVRHTHRLLDGQIVGLDEPFVSSSGARMMFPGDISLAAPADEIVDCRCRVKTVVDWLSGVK